MSKFFRELTQLFSFWVGFLPSLIGRDVPHEALERFFVTSPPSMELTWSVIPVSSESSSPSFSPPRHFRHKGSQNPAGPWTVCPWYSPGCLAGWLRWGHLIPSGWNHGAPGQPTPAGWIHANHCAPVGLMCGGCVADVWLPTRLALVQAQNLSWVICRWFAVETWQAWLWCRNILLQVTK
jgi:hypothetical protein